MSNYIETGKLTITIKESNGKCVKFEGSTNIDMEKLQKTIKLCDEYKCSFLTLFKEIFENTTTENIEKMLMELSM